MIPLKCSAAIKGACALLIIFCGCAKTDVAGPSDYGGYLTAPAVYKVGDKEYTYSYKYGNTGTLADLLYYEKHSTPENAARTARYKSNLGQYAAGNISYNNFFSLSQSDGIIPIIDEVSVIYNIDGQRLFLGRQYSSAKDKFLVLTRNYPVSSWDGEARYYLAQVYVIQNRYLEALRTFQAIIAYHPSGSYAPDACFGIGYVYYKMNDLVKARAALTDYIDRYGDGRYYEEAISILSRL